MWEFLQNWKMVVLPVLLGLISHFLIFELLRKIARHTGKIIDDSLVRHCYRPLQWTIVVFVIRLVLPAGLPEAIRAGVNHVLSLFLIAAVSWLFIKTVYVLEDFVVYRFSIEVKDNLRARKIHTQLRVLKRLVIIVVSIIALASLLMTFPKVRQFGAAILASAGIIGIVVGMAAQRTLGTFIAGLQIAFTQPIRVDDVVIVENEYVPKRRFVWRVRKIIIYAN